ncbi:FAD-dependent oxidoreductase [Methylocella silvestris]|uniref:FAD-dependent oxidoreductase n=1 Tax=Methylocella silvestris TaxID=199596 RepID=A0A2J7TM40_METSI|nr:GMC family oxidoreductase [Methylocella silvestris]PNG27846.1 FAD-dependent oxidoreductase [Methylocella silvestris]
MLIDARQVDARSVVLADVCIVGAGAAGISMALELAEKGIEVALLEGGGVESDPVTQSLYGGENVGLAHEPPEESRCRYLGGSTNCWGGWCRPMDDGDFDVRPWVPNSGWPMTKADLTPYYRRAHPWVELSDIDYEIGHWAAKIARGKAKLLPVDGSGLCTIIDQFSPPTRFGAVYRSRLSHAPKLKLFLFANVTEILTNLSATQATGVRVATLNGNEFRVFAKAVALAAGGIENPRLLLASNAIAEAGLGNANDLVGRYYMDHPRIHSTRVAIADAEPYRALYDATLPRLLRGSGKNRLSFAAHLAPGADMQRQMRLPNSRTYLVARSGNDVSKTYFALKALRRAIRGRKQFGYPMSRVWRDLTRQAPVLLAHAPRTAIIMGEALLSPFLRRRNFYLETVIEPVPNPQSRVSLLDERDRLGVPKVQLDWRLTSLDKDHYFALNAIIVAALTTSGLVSPFDVLCQPDAWPSEIIGCWHHMGTTRMHRDPAQGVVDADCEVHGVRNLFIAGSSVFPTVGSDSPTLTLVALALRLSDRIATLFLSRDVATRS